MPSSRTVSFGTARALLEHLSPLDTETWPTRKFIFRGQPDADFGLEASAHRLQGRIAAPLIYGTKDVRVHDQIWFEASLLLAFLEGCDRSGLIVPGDSPELRLRLQHGMQELMDGPGLWPEKGMYQALAVAQHHGVPTCLLDWTQRSYVAAYFAASSALSSVKQPEHIAIWALDVSEAGKWRGLDFIQLPGGTSSNLAAQAGVFTATRNIQPSDEIFLPAPMQGTNPYSWNVSLTQYTLPFKEAVSLLEGCHRLGVSGSTLFPGYEGVAREVQDLANMQRKDVDWDMIALRDIL